MNLLQILGLKPFTLCMNCKTEPAEKKAVHCVACKEYFYQCGVRGGQKSLALRAVPIAAKPSRQSMQDKAARLLEVFRSEKKRISAKDAATKAGLRLTDFYPAKNHLNITGYNIVRSKGKWKEKLTPTEHPLGTRECHACGAIKPFAEFARDAHNRGGYSFR